MPVTEPDTEKLQPIQLSTMLTPKLELPNLELTLDYTLDELNDRLKGGFIFKANTEKTSAQPSIALFPREE